MNIKNGDIKKNLETITYIFVVRTIHHFTIIMRNYHFYENRQNEHRKLKFYFINIYKKFYACLHIK